jgi:hypothetical protein
VMMDRQNQESHHSGDRRHQGRGECGGSHIGRRPARSDEDWSQD